MSANRLQVCNYKIRNRRERQRWLWSVQGLALLLLAALGCVSAAAQSVAYVPTHKSNSVAVVNTATNSVIDIIPVGIQPLSGAMSPNGQEVYVTNSGWIFGSNSVSVINTLTNTVVATIPVGNFPIGVAFTPNGAFAYVVNSSANSVSVINTASNTVTATIAVQANPRGVAVTPDGAFAYISNRIANTVSVVNTATNSVVATVMGVALFPEAVIIR